MPTLTGTLAEITGAPIDPDSLHRVTVRAPSRRASLTDQSRLVASVSVPVEVSAGGVISVDLEPGPAILLVEGEGYRDPYELGVTEDMTLLSEAVAESAPAHERSWVESVMVQLRADAVAAATAAGEDRVAAESAAGAAASSASAADSSAGEASAAAGAAAQSASAAASSAGAASGSATSAAGSATDAAGAVTDARAARDAAEGHASSAAGSASAASQSASEADSHADRAETAANEFGLTATSSTLAPGAAATVTVSGDGPAYSLAFGVPQGPKGDKGDEGEISQAQLDAAVASLVDGAPEALDTLTELADALGNDPNFATTVSTQIGERAKTSDVNAALAGKADAGAEATATWAGVSGKPSTFPPTTGGTAGTAKPGDWLPAWSEVSGKPATFPPASHSHTAAEVGARPSSWVPSWSEVSGKPATFAPEAHTHTKGEVGLGNVDNTSDTDKPVSTATQAALTPLQSRVGAAPATWRWNGTTLPTAASQVHAQARVGDFIVAPNLTTDPGWHQITGV